MYSLHIKLDKPRSAESGQLEIYMTYIVNPKAIFILVNKIRSFLGILSVNFGSCSVSHYKDSYAVVNNISSNLRKCIDLGICSKLLTWLEMVLWVDLNSLANNFSQLST